MMRAWLFVSAVLLAIAGTDSLAGVQRPDVTLWVTLGDSDQLVEVDAYTFTEIRRITTDPKPHGLAASADGSKIYVASDRTTRKVLANIQFERGSGPKRILVAPKVR